MGVVMFGLKRKPKPFTLPQGKVYRQYREKCMEEIRRAVIGEGPVAGPFNLMCGGSNYKAEQATNDFLSYAERCHWNNRKRGDS
jgi:hypothetical protein